MHLKRWITALILIPIVIYTVGFSPSYFFYLFLIIVFFLGLKEFYNIISAPFLFQLLGYIISFLFFALIFKGSMYLFLFIVSLMLIIPMSFFILSSRSPDKEILQDIGMTMFSIIYITIPFCMLMIIYRHPDGKAWIFFLLCIVIFGDTGAFYFGRLIGKHKLHEKISPNKTWEGAIGGLLCSVISGLMFIKAFRLSDLSFSSICFLVFISIIAQLGDLAESFIKRSFNLKDSGSILPGHGGILDRIDSLLFTIPFLYGYIASR